MSAVASTLANGLGAADIADQRPAPALDRELRGRRQARRLEAG
jgi:hypothetical protein